MADNDKLSRGTLIGFIGGLIGVALTASTGNEQLIAGAFVVGCILGVIFGTVKSDWKQPRFMSDEGIEGVDRKKAKELIRWMA